MNPFLLVLIILGAIAGWLAIWTGVVALIGLMGWRTLADRWPAEAWPEAGEGVALSGQSGYVGLSRYSGVLHAVLAEDGLYLRPMKLFAVNHPPLFIPWFAVAAVERGAFGGVKLRVDGGTLSLGGRLGKQVAVAVAAAQGELSEGELGESGLDEGVSDERTERRTGLRVG